MKAHGSKIENVCAELRERIISKQFMIGDLLPIEAELATQFDCSTGTISKALALLQHEGLIERRTRVGSRVIHQSRANTMAPGVELELDAFAFIYPTRQHEGVWRTVRGFQEAAHAASRRTVMLTTGLNIRKETELIARLSEFDVKGAVIYPVLPLPQDVIHFSQMVLNCKFPIVLAEVSLPGMGLPAVISDGFHAGQVMTERLIRSGCQKIGFLAQYSWTTSVRDRYMGYCKAIEEAKLEVDPSCVLLESTMSPNYENPLQQPTDLARRFLVQAKGIDAIVAANEFLALGCLDAAHEMGLSVPKDIKVAGIDDYVLKGTHHHELTSYHIPCEEVGRRSFSVLNDLILGHKPPMEILVRGHMIGRKTG